MNSPNFLNFDELVYSTTVESEYLQPTFVPDTSFIVEGEILSSWGSALSVTPPSFISPFVDDICNQDDVMELMPLDPVRPATPQPSSRTDTATSPLHIQSVMDSATSPCRCFSAVDRGTNMTPRKRICIDVGTSTALTLPELCSTEDDVRDDAIGHTGCTLSSPKRLSLSKSLLSSPITQPSTSNRARLAVKRGRCRSTPTQHSPRRRPAVQPQTSQFEPIEASQVVQLESVHQLRTPRPELTEASQAVQIEPTDPIDGVLCLAYRHTVSSKTTLALEQQLGDNFFQHIDPITHQQLQDEYFRREFTDDIQREMLLPF